MKTRDIRASCSRAMPLTVSLRRMRGHEAALIDEMQCGDTYRLAYIRGPEGIIVALAKQLG